MTILSADFGFQKNGPYCGSFSFFILIGGCNLRCPGYGQKYRNYKGTEITGCSSFACVDKHTFKKTWTTVKTFSEMKFMIDALSPPSGVKYDLVITGGEPLLYWNSAFFQSLIKGALITGHKVIIETNASLDISFEFAYQKEIIFSQSIKVFSSGELPSKSINMITLKSIQRNAKTKIYRVLTSELTWEEDLLDIKTILFDGLGLKPNDIWLVPISGNNGEDYLYNSLFINKKALEHGFNISK